MLPYFEFSLELLRHHSCWVNLKENRQRVSDPNHIHPAIYIPKWNREVINKQFLYAPIKLQRIMNMPYDVSYWQLYMFPKLHSNIFASLVDSPQGTTFTEFQYLDPYTHHRGLPENNICTWINKLSCKKMRAMETEASPPNLHSI